VTWVLVRKLLRDVRVPLLVVAVLLCLFQCLWAKITQRVLGEIAPFFNALAAAQDLNQRAIENIVFSGPGKMVRTLMGGESISLERAMDMMSIAYVHPLVVVILCIWAVGRSSGAIAGEIDRGTMELLLAQPLARFRLILAHLWVDLLTIPILCLSTWAGNWLGPWLAGPIEVKVPDSPDIPLAVRLILQRPVPPELLAIDSWAFAPALLSVGGLLFAVSGYTLWVSACGRFRWRVLGVAVFVTLIQFLINLVGQMWEEALGWLRPLTVFYYYQPQNVILGRGWSVDFSVWNHGHALVHVPGAAVLFAVGLAGYALALWTFTRRDLPAPL
jgi:ABC-2 type transport system permease protein